MLTKKQIKELPKGTYTNEDLRKMFPKQQGVGNSRYYLGFEGKNEKEGWYRNGIKLN